MVQKNLVLFQMHLFIYSSSFIYLFIYFFYLFIYLFVCLFIYLFIYSFFSPISSMQKTTLAGFEPTLQMETA